MTRRDYVLIADILRQFKGAPDHPMICQGFADGLGDINKAFDKAMFLRNCGLTS